MPDRTSLVNDLNERSRFDTRPEEDVPSWRVIVERLSDQAKHVESLPIDDSWIQLWGRLERLIAPWQFGDVGLDDPPKWEKVATVPDDEVLGTFIALRVKDGVAFILRKGGSYRADVREHAKSVGVLGECFDEIAARINPAGWHERAPARVLRGEREPRQTPKEI